MFQHASATFPLRCLTIHFQGVSPHPTSPKCTMASSSSLAYNSAMVEHPVEAPWWCLVGWMVGASRELDPGSGSKAWSSLSKLGYGWIPTPQLGLFELGVYIKDDGCGRATANPQRLSLESSTESPTGSHLTGQSMSIAPSKEHPW